MVEMNLKLKPFYLSEKYLVVMVRKASVVALSSFEFENIFPEINPVKLFSLFPGSSFRSNMNDLAEKVLKDNFSTLRVLRSYLLN